MLTPYRKYLTLAIVFLSGLSGFWLGPKDLEEGNYSAKIDLILEDKAYSIDYPFVLDQNGGQQQSFTKTIGEFQLVVEGRDTYKYQIDQNISYRISVTDALGEPLQLTLDNATSTLRGPNYGQVLPPTSRADESLEFTMRIPYKAKISTALLFAVAVLWLTELVPLGASALLIPVVIVVAGVADASMVFQSFFHPIVVLFLAGFLLAEGMRRSGTDRLIALNILQHASLKPAYLMLTMMILSAFLSMWMSNTASIAIIIPIVLAILEKIPDDGNRTGFRRALILGVAYAATIGGIGSAIGTPANILALTFLNEYTNANLAFIDWFYFGLPIVILMIPIIWLYLILVFRVKLQHIGPHLSHDTYEKELKSLGALSKDQRLLLLVFVAIIGLFLTEGWHHIHPSIVALSGVLVFFFTETIKQEDMNHINWNALLTFGGGLTIGSILVVTGVSDWIVLHLIVLTNQPPLLVVLLVSGLTFIIGGVISNTAAAAMLIPLAIPLAQILHMDPRMLVAVVAITSSLDFALIVGTPPTMMAYSTGFFEAKEIFFRGVGLDLIALLVLDFGVIWIWQWLGIVYI
ncbi:MAG: SLC13 family permease [Chloroflexota bacterium]